jgi:hypothetical protein
MKRTKKEPGRRNPMADAMRKRYEHTTTRYRHRSDRRAKDARRVRQEYGE